METNLECSFTREELVELKRICILGIDMRLRGYEVLVKFNKELLRNVEGGFLISKDSNLNIGGYKYKGTLYTEGD